MFQVCTFMIKLYDKLIVAYTNWDSFISRESLTIDFLVVDSWYLEHLYSNLYFWLFLHFFFFLSCKVAAAGIISSLRRVEGSQNLSGKETFSESYRCECVSSRSELCLVAILC